MNAIIKNFLILSFLSFPFFSFTVDIALAKDKAKTKIADDKIIENKAQFNIAVMDVENVVKNSSVVKDIQNKISKKQTEFQKEIDKRQSKLETEGKKIDSRKSLLSEEAYSKEREQFDKKVDNLKDFVEKKRTILKDASAKAMEEVNEKIKKIINDISIDKDLDLIIPASQTLFYKDKLDISGEVLKKLNDSLAKIDVEFRAED